MKKPISELVPAVTMVYDLELKKRKKERPEAYKINYGYYMSGSIHILNTLRDGVKEGLELVFHNDRILESSCFYEKGYREGIMYIYYPSGKQHSITYYSHNILNGLELTFFENGQLCTRSTYVDGKREGEFWSYSEIGILEKHCHYKNSVIYGTVTNIMNNHLSEEIFCKQSESNCIRKLYHANGICSTFERVQNGSVVDVTRSYYKSGELALIQYLEKDIINGARIQFYPNGSVKQIDYYDNGKLIDRVLNFYDTGILHRCIGIGKKGRDGKSITYHSNGEESSVAHFYKDQLWFKATSYHQSGVLSSSVVFLAGKRFGRQNSYYISGSLRSICYFWNNHITGHTRTYYENGSMLRKGYYSKSIKVGKHYEYYLKHQLKHVLKYNHNGVLDSVGYYYDEATGLCKERAVFHNGMMCWTVTILNEKGKRKGEYMLMNRNLHGISRVFFPNDMVWKEWVVNSGGMITHKREYNEHGVCMMDDLNCSEEYGSEGFDIRQHSYFISLLRESPQLNSDYFVEYDE